MIESYKVSDGVLTLGAGATAFAQQVRAFSVVPAESVEEEDDIEVLSGETLVGEDTVSHDYTVQGKILQDLTAAGFVAHTWANAGAEEPFTFQPKGSVLRAVTGVVRVVPVTIGGDVKARAESDFTWSCIGTPVFGDYVPAP